MSETKEAVWRSSLPEVVGLWDQWNAQEDTYREAVRALMAELNLSDRTPVERVSGAWGGDDYLIGVRGDCPGPDWRRDKDGYWIPRRASKAQKALAAKFDAVRRPDFRAMLPGMPKNAFVGLSVMAPGAEKHGNALYVHWATDSIADKVDEFVWERIKLSEFYAVREAEEAEATP